MPNVEDIPDPLDRDDIYNLDNVKSFQALRNAKLGTLLRAICRRLDADPGVTSTDLEETFFP